MLDIKFIREHVDLVKDAISKKQIDLDLDQLLTLDDKRKELQFELDQLRHKQNDASDAIAKASKEEKVDMIKQMKNVSEQADDVKNQLNPVEQEFQALMFRVPQIPVEGTPIGGEEANEVVKTVGEVRTFDFKVKNHLELLQMHDMVDIERGVKVMGTRGYYFKGVGAQLELAILQYALEFLRERGFTQYQVPVMADEFYFYGTGHLPAGGDELFKVYDQRLKKGEDSESVKPKLLTGTAEIGLCGYYAKEVLDAKEMPAKMMAMSTCFRTEVGSYGKDTQGLYRVKQFNKVEQVIMCEADEAKSEKFFAELLANAEAFLQSLELPYRVIRNATADMGMGKREMVDIETWMPSRENYGETHSCSRLGDWQARRLEIKYKDENGKNVYCHTLNNTLVATPRIMIPLLEYHQEADGSINIPQALRPYMNGLAKIA